MSTTLHRFVHDPHGPPAGRFVLPRIVLLGVLSLLALVACTGEPSGDPPQAPASSAAVSSVVSSPEPPGSVDPATDLCQRVADVQTRLDSMRAVELRLPNRVALDIELDKLQAAYGQLREVEFGESEEILAGSLRRLGYRLAELELAVEDFRTNPRPRQAVAHVETDAQKVADELAAFIILSRC